ncbi:DUF2919 family protein [Alteromonas gilva]|uniref:DUF2919 family protein n=1 Tax=Alteromonas gilva TaxID=2987522 RepID=A0ABT5L1M7_9ALTE|nr:DUF2919 family protein [Alteromonas gilva]MDC8830939.1 DUF2919 family protein [Alteromonas gilva]
MLKLPLNYYDEAGVVLPPRWFYWMLMIACRDVLLVCAFAAIPAESDRLYRLFFPHSDSLWLQLLSSLPFIAVIILLSFRGRLWQVGCSRWRLAVRPLCWLGCLTQLMVVSYLLQRSGWQFDLYLGAVIVLLVAFTIMLVRSRHLTVMLDDWQQLPAVIGASENQ